VPAVERLDHLVLTVRDLDATCAFYRRALGMEVVVHALVAAHPTPGSANLCFLTESPLDRWISHLAHCGVALLEGPVERTGAEGPIESGRGPDRIDLRPRPGRQPDRGVAGGAGPPDAIEPLREWLRRFASRVRAVDVEGGRKMCDGSLIAFGTVAVRRRARPRRRGAVAAPGGATASR
jgi:catechol 2,3-dioxygenase-like lactoylglutathione lyase family enzyme